MFREGLRGQSGWKPVWRDPEPKAEYDALIIGGGGHGLATAYYLASEHGLTNIAVLEKGYLSAEEADQLLNVRALTEGGIQG